MPFCHYWAFSTSTRTTHLVVLVQETGIHAGACIAAFHTAVACQCCSQVSSITGEQALVKHVNTSMHIMQTAAQSIEELASLRESSTVFVAHLTAFLVRGRRALDARVQAIQRSQMKAAVLPILDFDTEHARLKPFQIQLRNQQKNTPQVSSTKLTEKSASALCGVPEPPTPGIQSSSWCTWLHGMMMSSRQSWSSTMLCLQQVEQHLFACAEQHIANSPLMKGSQEPFLQNISIREDEVQNCVTLVTRYSQMAARVEAWPACGKAVMLRLAIRTLPCCLSS